MPGKRNPPPVFVARSHDPFKTNFGVTEDGTVYIIETRGHFVGGWERPTTEGTRKLVHQHGPTARKWRARLIDQKGGQA